MKKIFAIILFAILATGCTQRIQAGNVGVKFDLYGGEKGVTGEIVGPGRHWLGWSEEIYTFPTFSQNIEWKGTEAISYQDKEGTVVSSDVGMTYNVDGAKADVVFQKFRKQIDEITDGYLRNMVRDAINAESAKLDVADLYGSGKEGVITRATERVRKEVAPFGIIIERLYWTGAARVPANIQTAINNKVAAVQAAQQRENDLQTATAQAQIEREKARGEADAMLIAATAQAEANRKLSQSIDGNLVQYKSIEKWDGKLPQVSGGSTPFVNLK